MSKLSLKILFLLLCFLLAYWYPLAISIDAKEGSLYQIDHSRISINGNDDLIQQVSSQGWKGNGTINNSIIISNLFINSSSGNGIYIHNTTLYIKIVNSTINMQNGGVGIYLDSVQNLYLINDTIQNSKDFSVFIYNSKINMFNNSIKNNSDYGIYLYNGNYNIIGNNISNNGKDGLYTQNIQFSNISNNLFVNNSESSNYDNRKTGDIYYSIEIDTINDCWFINNTIVSRSDGFLVSFSNRITIKNNIILSIQNANNIYIANTYNLEIINNLFFYGTLNNGYYLPSNNVTISNNTFWGSSASINAQGFHLIEKNFFTQVPSSIDLIDGSSGNIVKNNYIFNSDSAITLSGTSNNIITGNIIEKITYIQLGIFDGIIISSNNTVYNNGFLDKVISITVDNNSTKWDNGSIGNYWGDYTGNDLNSDNIGDVPAIHHSHHEYSIQYANSTTKKFVNDVTIIDSYPLMKFIKLDYANTINKTKIYLDSLINTYNFSYLTNSVNPTNYLSSISTHASSLLITSNYDTTSNTQGIITNSIGNYIFPMIFLSVIALSSAFAINTYYKKYKIKNRNFDKELQPSIKKFCPNCNSKLEKYDLFCSNCGTKLS